MTDWQRATDGAVPGDVIAGKYELVRSVGRGGMGTVFEARHVTLGRPLAVKVLRPDVADDRDVIERFLREARSVAALTHPRIVDVFDVGWTDDGVVPWFAMELLEGRSLAEELKAIGSMPAQRAVSILVQVLDALEVAHGQGIVHRDLKPENVFLVHHGIEDDVKVLDFGISKVLDKRITVTGVILGTPAYMSPEQARGAREVDHRVDVYAAGAILYEMLSGRPPFEGTSFHQVLLAIMTGERPHLQKLMPNLHPVLASATERALSPKPQDRWQTATEMRDALAAIGDEIDRLLASAQESSLGSVKTRAWVPGAGRGASAPAEEASDEPVTEAAPSRFTPRAAAARPTPRAAAADPPVGPPPPEPSAASAGVPTPRSRAMPRAGSADAPRPLLEGVGPARPSTDPSATALRPALLVSLLVVLGLALGAGAVAIWMLAG